MANLKVNEVYPEQGIAEYGYKNVKQFDLTAFYNQHLIASLWQDEEKIGIGLKDYTTWEVLRI